MRTYMQMRKLEYIRSKISTQYATHSAIHTCAKTSATIQTLTTQPFILAVGKTPEASPSSNSLPLSMMELEKGLLDLIYSHVEKSCQWIDAPE